MIGAQKVTYKTSATGADDRKNIAALTYTSTTMYGTLQPVSVHETVTNIDNTNQDYRFITAPTPVALAAKATDRLVDAYGTIYRVYGVKVQPRLNGAPHHVEIMMANPSGLNA